MNFRFTRYKGNEPDFKDKNAYAIEYGPLLMAVIGDSVKNGCIELTTAREFPNVEPTEENPLHFTAQEGNLRLIPYYNKMRNFFARFE